MWHLAARMTELPERGARETLSKRIWGFDWSEELPWDLDGIRAEAASFAEGLSFVEAHYAAIFGPLTDGSRFLSDAMTPAKRRFGDEMDVIAFRDGPETVGVWMGHPSDWSSYYVRSVAFLEAYRDRRIMTGFLERCYAPLRRIGVERLETECSPANLPVMKILTRDGWVVTSTTNSERWGAVVRLSKFLRQEAETVFFRQFCGVRNGRAPREAGVPPNPGTTP